MAYEDIALCSVDVLPLYDKPDSLIISRDIAIDQISHIGRLHKRKQVNAYLAVCIKKTHFSDGLLPGNRRHTCDHHPVFCQNVTRKINPFRTVVIPCNDADCHFRLQIVQCCQKLIKH